MVYVWKTVNFPATTPTTGQHYTAPILSGTNDGSLALIQQLITDTSGPGPYSLTGFVVGFDAFGNLSPYVPQTTIASAPNAFANSAALSAFEDNDQYRLAFPGSRDGAVGFLVKSDGTSWNIVRDIITAPENSATFTITETPVASISIASGDTIVGEYAPSRGSGVYGVAYEVQDSGGNVTLFWQGYNANDTVSNGSPVSLGIVAISGDTTPAMSVFSGGGAFIRVYENVNGTNHHYITFQSFNLNGTNNTVINGGTGTYSDDAGNTNVTDITAIRSSQFPAGVASGAITTVVDQLQTDGKYHVVYHFDVSLGNFQVADLGNYTTAQHVQVRSNNTTGESFVGWGDSVNGGGASFAEFDSSGIQAGSTFTISDASLHFVNMVSLQDGRIAATFTKVIDSGTDTTQDVIKIVDFRAPGQTLDYSATNTGDTENIAGTSGADSIIASDNDFTYIAGAGAGDVFTFNTLKLPVGFGDDQITDYKQGDTGHYSSGEGDQIDISGLSGGSSITGASIHIIDLGYEGTFLAVDPNGATGGFSYWGIAQLDGIHVGQTVNLIVDNSQLGGINVGVDFNQGYAGNFNGGSDGRSDILLTKDDGTVAVWEMAANGFSIQAGANIGKLGTGWHVLGVGNFNAGSDSNSDILLRHDSGKVAIWEMNGTSIQQGGNVGTLTFDWHISGTGDFNGDGNTDILLHNDDTGTVAIWKMNGFAIQAGSGNVAALTSNWHISGTGDFDNDGNSDILLVNDINATVAIWEMNGTSIKAGANVATLGSGWHVAGTGDFNGDSKSDILLINDNGNVAEWQMNGTSIQQGGNVAHLVSGWHVAGTGDYNADTHDDILLHSDSGQTAVWEMGANGFTIATGHNISALTTDWETTAHHYDFV